MKGSFFCSGRLCACIAALAAVSLVTSAAFAQADDSAEGKDSTGDAEPAAEDGETAAGEDTAGACRALCT